MLRKLYEVEYEYDDDEHEDVHRLSRHKKEDREVEKREREDAFDHDYDERR